MAKKKKVVKKEKPVNEEKPVEFKTEEKSSASKFFDEFISDLKYPSEQDKNKLLIGIILSALGIFILPLIAVFGYITKFTKSVIQAKPEMPEWTNFFDLIKTGLPVFVYVLLITICAFIPFVGWIIILVLGFMFPMVLCRYADKSQFSEIFNFAEVIDKIQKSLKKYVGAWVCYIIVLAVIGWIISTIASIGGMKFLFLTTIISAVLNGAVSFYFLVAMARTFGKIYTQA